MSGRGDLDSGIYASDGREITRLYGFRVVQSIEGGSIVHYQGWVASLDASDRLLEGIKQSVAKDLVLKGHCKREDIAGELETLGIPVDPNKIRVDGEKSRFVYSQFGYDHVDVIDAVPSGSSILHNWESGKVWMGPSDI